MEEEEQQQEQERHRCEKIIAILDKAIKDGPWDKTIFLKASGKNLRELRAGLHAYMEALKGPETAESNAATGTQTRYLTVYISL
ncbi:unnamed protein product, partial [marine sediment metagenome]